MLSLTRPISPICQSPFVPYLTLKFLVLMHEVELFAEECKEAEAEAAATAAKGSEAAAEAQVE